MRLTRKTNSSELRRDGKGFVHMGMCVMSVVKGERLSPVLHGDFPKVGVG